MQITVPQLALVILAVALLMGLTTTGTWTLASWRIKNGRGRGTPEKAAAPEPYADAQVSEWIATGECIPVGTKADCGKGTVVVDRVCSREATGGGKTCAQLGLRKTADCYKACKRPPITDWGHPNDPDATGPRKGWYDITGQGAPNDYCRWVGDGPGKHFACQTISDPYLSVDQSQPSFSAGPANRLLEFDGLTLRQKCPVDSVMYTGAGSTDPDFKKSIANGFYAHCGARCVYDHRNPTRQGWYVDAQNKVSRIDDMRTHTCGKEHAVEMDLAVKRYEDVYDQRNAWKVGK